MGSIEEFVVHQIASGPNTFLTNAFLVETSGSVVAVDAMMTVSDARDLRRHVDNLGKPLRAVLITHGHHDHYNGVGELLKGLGRIPVVATESVDRTMRRIDDAKEVQWRPVFGEEWPKERVFPDRFVVDGDTLLFDGVPFTVRELCPGVSSSDLLWTVGRPSKVAFAGDVVFGGVHSFMNDGHTMDWLASLDILEKEMRYLGVLPGSVSPFNLLNGKGKDVSIIFDQALLRHEKLVFHPNGNTASLVLSVKDFKKYLQTLGNRIEFVDLSP